MSKEPEIDWKKVPDVIVANHNPKKKVGRPTTRVKRAKERNCSTGWWPEEMRIEVVALFATVGNARRVSEITGVPEGTIRAWKTQEWWTEMMHRVRDDEAEEVDCKFTKIVNKALDEISDRLENGDMVYNARTGETARVKVKAKDAAIVAAISVDKRELLRGNVTARVEKVDTTNRLSDLAEQFAKFAAARNITPTNVVVEDVEIVNESD